ncbi:DUF29 domain-containing protein [Endozoicomonas sp. 8E]|uniref:DUF29 domain-containing protein n=1 Tax=Endozoicomonas sp. 8E TaxID=3035692 RepID=UPI002938FABD|nr:DUF29 domain-containing protein [Endozoicomonas sp. 8E]WOG27983.1 DUF29 domain-containing protein [Endozoicomonas sp. 8E]
MSNLYKTDYTQWLSQQRELLAQRQFDQLDIDNLLEAMDSEMGDNTRELGSHFKILLIHLLKYDHQKRVLQDHWVEDKVLHTWVPSINNARVEIEDILTQNPCLQSSTEAIMDDVYPKAKKSAIEELNRYIKIKSKRLNKNSFPKECPWSFEQATKKNWLPGD